MERRKFVIGLGALASGTAAAVGTGAFTSVNADRSVDVEVAGDANAYLALEQTSNPNSQQYVQVNNGEVAIDFSSSNPNTNSTTGTGDLGNGFNPDAVTNVNSLLRVTNQGTQDVTFTINHSLSTGNADVTLSTDDQGGEDDLVANSITLTPGDSIDIDLTVDTTDQGPAEITDGTVTFVAEATN